MLGPAAGHDDVHGGLQLREGGREGGREGDVRWWSGKDGGREGGSEGGREGLLTSAPEEGVQTCRAWTSRTWGRKRGREEGRERGREGGREGGLAYLSAGRRGPDVQGVDVEDVRECEELLTKGGEVQALRSEVQKNTAAL